MSIWGQQVDPPLSGTVQRMNAKYPLFGVNQLKEKFIIESYNFFTNNVITKDGQSTPIEFVHMIVTTEKGALVEARTAAPRIMNIFRQPPEVLRQMLAKRDYTRFVHMPGENPGDYGYWTLE